MVSEFPGPSGTPWFASLGTRLLGFALLLVVLPAAIFAVLTFSSARRALEESAGRQLATAAHEAAEHVGDPLEQERRSLRVWSRQDVMGDLVAGDPQGRVARFLAALVEQDGAYLALEAVDRNGIVLAAADPRQRQARRMNDAWFTAALTGQPALRGPEEDEVAGRRVLHLASRIRPGGGAGEVVGVLHLVLDWTRVEAQLARSRADLASIGLETRILLVRAGSVIGSSLGNGTGDASTAPLVHAAERAFAEHQSPAWVVAKEARALLGIYRPAGGQKDWGVVVAQPLRDALAPIHELEVRWIVVFACVLVAATAVAGIQGARMIRPLRELTAVTRQVAATGRPMPAPDVARGDEIGELAASFTQMSDRLDRAQEDLVEATRLALVGELAAGVAHEVRTPLSVLRSSTQLLHRALPPGERHADELARLMLDEIDRLERLVAGLLELARPRPPARVATALPEVLDRVADLAAAQAQGSGVEIVRTYAGLDVPALCDPDQIRQVALNLVVNALQHARPHGRVEIRGVTADGRVGFEVADDGPGIDDANRERVFLPFFTTRAGGTGLGLALVKAIVEAHRGRVSLESGAGQGAVFRVLLPAAEVQG
jgi:signal transduction histidine kinase